ncbi:MAG: SDR family oxidoreductase, partial [Bacteroidota bacterium]|nr:SDR family oxidoreductase [Bacteroidota bacterium]
MIDFEGKKVLITGGSRGIGASCVKLFSSLNAFVVFTYRRNAEAADSLIKSLHKVDKIVPAHINFKKPDEAEKRINGLVTKYNGFDILINNAGIWTYGEADAISVEDWDMMMTVNMTSMFLCSKAVIPNMKLKRYGKIINIASTAGQRGEAFHSHYAASKGGMISYTKSLAAELGIFNINVNCVAPGWVLTDMNVEVFADKEYQETERLNIPLKRIAEPEDIAGPV